MNANRFLSTALSGLVCTSAVAAAPLAARADTASTVAIAAGAAAIVGALLYDGNNHPYYVRNGHRYYVTPGEAQYYRGHHHGVVRSAYVPEREYPVARDPYHAGSHAQSNGHGRDNGHDRDHNGH